ncbi:MAG: GxxExxY protein [Planctomycetota bacterium]
MALIHKGLTREIIGACMEVSSELGCGFVESVYENALMIALEDRGLAASQQAALDVIFRDTTVGTFFADVVVNDAVIVELKAVKELLPEHRAQVLNYLKATGLRVGLLVNFARPKLQWERLVR